MTLSISFQEIQIQTELFVNSDLSNSNASGRSHNQAVGQTYPSSKNPRVVLQNQDAPYPHTIFAFPPNRDTLGATAYFIVDEVNILIDCPAWNEVTQNFLQEQGGVHWLILTHRGGIGSVGEIQRTFNSKVVIQEQEAYLLPELSVTRFKQDLSVTSNCQLIWTPGHSPGSSCVYYNRFGGVLFSGRHLLPTPQHALQPQKTAKTFHWRRQLQSIKRLLEQFSPETLQWICPGANIGFLRGKYAVEQGYQHLAQLDLDRKE
ncbi:MBL fold metallo-hydrolase [Kovacikia minuta CCNUW1]|uniref:MBL fold metallo-hydrolase n=1 Tax=Kovacikia minuta TaxID=2931930 RepID=UPI001CCAC476|nr:MBL fold metallo-hydrolase [Kovacikia minuta]UBF28999.1 MBL fold metallo-hydrolase [Kovacikia minuta CCNUW1]